MSSNINEVGVLNITQEKNVLFTKRDLKNITVIGTESVSIEFEKIAKEGSVILVQTVEYESFKQSVEGLIWEMIDKPNN